VFLKSPLNHIENTQSSGFLGLIKKFTTTLSTSKREEEKKARYISIDAPVSLNTSNPIAQLTKEDVLFGEMTCMNNYPRSATVRAKTDVSLLEIRRNVLYILQRNKESKAILDGVYNKRSISTHLRSIPLFAEQFTNDKDFEQFVDLVREKANLVRLNPGDVLFRQGDAEDNFYLVRIGFVKIWLKQPGGDHVINYTGPGGMVGEIALMGHLAELKGKLLAQGRTASATALDHVDLVSISGQEPSKNLVKLAKERNTKEPMQVNFFYHLMASVAFKVADYVNNKTDFSKDTAVILNNGAVVQIYTKVSARGQQWTLQKFSSRWPGSIFSPIALDPSKSYYSTGIKQKFTFDVKPRKKSLDDPQSAHADMDAPDLKPKRSTVKAFKPEQPVGTEKTLGRKRRT
jgi:CRP-like cAMP-binding protein